MALRGTAKRISSFIKKWTPLLVFVFILFFAFPPMAPAQVQTRVRVIEASNVGSVIDPSLRDLHGQLGSLFRYTSYRLLRDERLTLSPNQPASVPIHQGRSIEITQVGLQANMAELRVRIKRDGADILNTQVRLSPGRTVLIGGPKHGEGVVILALSANL
ncbi:MAG: hypothetical protein QME83_05715 [Thermodesulfobacteriota bacterium]|nr:hypothetical protein [Thermodesulfobacteriota bacterium]